MFMSKLLSSVLLMSKLFVTQQKVLFSTTVELLPLEANFGYQKVILIGTNKPLSRNSEFFINELHNIIQ